MRIHDYFNQNVDNWTICGENLESDILPQIYVNDKRHAIVLYVATNNHYMYMHTLNIVV